MGVQKPHFSARLKHLFPESFLSVSRVSASPFKGDLPNNPNVTLVLPDDFNPNADKHALEVQVAVFATRQASLDGGEQLETINKTYYVNAVTNVYAQAEALLAKEFTDAVAI